MKNQKKLTILLGSILGVLVLTLGITFAVFTYQQTGTNNQQLVLGDIYMHYQETNQLKMENAMPQEGFKTLITGYLVNPIMVSQDAEDTSTELYACINLFQNEWGWDLEEGEDFESFCRGTGTRAGYTFQEDLDEVFGEDDYNTMLSLNIIQEETLEYTNIKLNPELATQTVEYENELTACVTFLDSMGINEALDEKATTETFCQGTGTIMNGNTLQQWWDEVSQQDGFMEAIGNTLINNNVMILENDAYIVNPDMANQTVGEINELTRCVGLVTSFGYEFDEGTTAESSCKGEGTYDGGMTLKGEFEEAKDNIFYMNFVGRKLLENNIIIASVDLPYFEFTISGKNTYKEKDIYFDVLLTHGNTPENKLEENRIEDEFLRFALYEVLDDNTEKKIFLNKNYSSLENKRIHVETIPKNTTEEINKTYRLYMWIDENVVIGNVDEDYTTEEWKDVFASIKVNVSGDFNEKELDYEDKYNVTDASCFETGEITIYTHNANMTNDELATCVNYLNTILGVEEEGVNVDVGETYEDYCKGTGTNWGYTFQFALDNYWFTDEELVYLEENNIIVENAVGLILTSYDTTCGSDVVIPETINGNNVVAIGERAFYDNQLTSIVIPDSVRTIGDVAFAVNQLTSVVIPNSVTVIGNHAFAENQLTNVVIGQSVITIGGSAFQKNKLTSVLIPNGVTTIGSFAFFDNQLISVDIPDSVTVIENNAFAKNKLTNVVIGQSVTTIGTSAFVIQIYGYGEQTNQNLESIINKSGNAFDWKNIISGTTGDETTTFEFGTYNYGSGVVEIVSE